MTAVLPPSSLDAAREEIARLREELQYRSAEKDRLEAERDSARRIAVTFEQENADLLSRQAGAELDAAAHRAATAIWREASIAHIAAGLTSMNDAVHLASRHLAQRLDEAGLNVDLAVDDYVDQWMECSPREAWKPPAQRRAERDAMFAKAPF